MDKGGIKSSKKHDDGKNTDIRMKDLQDDIDNETVAVREACQDVITIIEHLKKQGTGGFIIGTSFCYTRYEKKRC